MKKIFLSIILIFILTASHGQRYLTSVFGAADSIPNIPYGSAMNFKNMPQTLLLDFFHPVGDTIAKRPLVIYLHGGGFCDTAQSRKLLSIQAFCYLLAQRGYVAASIDYRLDSACFGPSFLSNRAIINAMHDAKAAIRFFKANAAIYRIDTTKIFIGGESAGAITALTASYINKTGEALYPPATPYSADNTIEGNSGNPGHTSNVKATLCLCGGTSVLGVYPVFDTTAMNSSSDPPVLIVHGTHDSLILVNASLNVAARATNLNIPSAFYPMYGASHCPWFYPLPNSWAYLDTLVNYSSSFLYPYVVNSTDINESTTIESVFRIFPNPFNSSATIFSDPDLPDGQAGSYRGNCSITIMDVTGSVVKRISGIDQFSYTLGRGNLASGIYILELQFKTKIERMKLIIN